MEFNQECTPPSSTEKEKARELLFELLLQQDKEGDDHSGMILGNRLAKPRPIESE